jgi:hypothetical protein
VLPLAAPENGEAGSDRTRWSCIFSKYGNNVARLCCSMAGYCP